MRENKVAFHIKDRISTPWTAWGKETKDSKQCGKVVKPDFVWEVSTHVLVLEVDQFQHHQPGYECEDKRCVDMYNSYGGLPTIIVRFNPDTFKVYGVTRKVLMKTRLEVVTKEINKWLSWEPSDNKLHIVRLFYDNDDQISPWRMHVTCDWSTGLFADTPL